ncbi:MAG TPA: hypothetical protein VEW68_10505, partial [Patescibacteria group bacterium]|nr:hypothetical protein [Patescibacteria group bacterium]
MPFVLGLGVFLYVEVHPSSVSQAKNPSWLDDIFSNGVILACIRLGLIVAAIYLVVSIVALIAEGRWLSELG